MSSCPDIEFDYAKALEQHQAKQVPIDPDEPVEAGEEQEDDWEARAVAVLKALRYAEIPDDGTIPGGVVDALIEEAEGIK